MKQHSIKSLWLGFSYLLFVGQVWLLWGFFVDDAYITFRYVKQWTHGNGLVYNVGERVEGYSNFLWVVLLAPVDLWGFDLVSASKVLGILLGLLTLTLVYFGAYDFGQTFYAPVLLAASAPFAAWAVGGLETMLFALLLTLGAALFIREEHAGRGWWSGLVFGLLALTRPEGIMFALIAIFFRAVSLYQRRLRPTQQDIVRVLCLAAIVVIYNLWRLWYYGYLLPNTVYAKSMGLHPRGPLEGGLYLFQSFEAAGGFFLLALTILLALFATRREFVSIYLVANISLYAAFIIVGGGDWMPFQRFLVHILPLVYWVTHLGLVNLRRIWPFRWSYVLVTLLVLGQAGYMLVSTFLEQNLIVNLQQAMQTEGNPSEDQTNSAIEYLKHNINPGDVVAVTDAGNIAYSLPLSTRIIDMVGLVDAHIAHLSPKFPNGLFGRGDAFGKWDVDYILSQNPRFVQVRLVEKLSNKDWTTTFTGTTLLVNDPRFQADYRLIDGLHFAIFERIED